MGRLSGCCGHAGERTVTGRVRCANVDGVRRSGFEACDRARQVRRGAGLSGGCCGCGVGDGVCAAKIGRRLPGNVDRKESGVGFDRLWLRRRNKGGLQRAHPRTGYAFVSGGSDPDGVATAGFNVVEFSRRIDRGGSGGPQRAGVALNPVNVVRTACRPPGSRGLRSLLPNSRHRRGADSLTATTAGPPLSPGMSPGCFRLRRTSNHPRQRGPQGPDTNHSLRQQLHQLPGVDRSSQLPEQIDPQPEIVTANVFERSVP